MESRHFEHGHRTAVVDGQSLKGDVVMDRDTTEKIGKERSTFRCRLTICNILGSQ